MEQKFGLFAINLNVKVTQELKVFDKIAKILNIDQNWHITIANTKGGIRPYIMK